MNIFAAGGILDEYLEGYQERKGQKEMAEMLSLGINSKECPNVILAEGAVGVGKSLAYLFSSLVSPSGTINQGPIIVSTSSITLQNQLEQKDLPFVQKVIEEKFGERISFVSLKGITNFCCPREFEKQSNILKVDHPEIYERYRHSSGSGEQPDEVDLEVWRTITTNHSDCDGSDCKMFTECYYHRRRAQAKTAHVVIINHALLATHWYLARKYGAAVLPEHRVLIIDECHELEQSILNFVGGTLSRKVLGRMASKYSDVTGKVSEMKTLSLPQIDKITDAFDTCAVPSILAVDWAGLDDLVAEITKENGPNELISKKYHTGEWREQMHDVVRDLRQVLEVAEEVGAPNISPISKYLDGFWELIEMLGWLQDSPEHVAIWVEGYGEYKSIKLTPVNVNEFLEPLWGVDSGPFGTKYILTSATAAVGDSFTYLKKQLGISCEADKTMEGVFESPFDYKNQVTHFFVPEDFNPKNANFDEQVLHGIKQILKHSPNEKTLILFTSYAQMNKLVPQIRLLYSATHVVLEQNPSMSKEFILRKFQESEKAILVAQAASFGTGVDIKGDKNIIITKLSFEVPTDPIFKTKERLLENKGGNGFFDLNVPIAAIRARQQVGRGIRSVDDKAIIAIFDGRIVTSRWGRVILRSLPPGMKLYRTI